MSVNYKRFVADETFSTEAAKTKSHVMYPYFKRGSVNWVYSKNSGILEDMGVALAASIATGQEFFLNEEFKPLITPVKRPVIYMHKYMLTKYHAAYMGEFIKAYTQPNDNDKPYNGQVPFGMVQACMFEFKMGYWRDPKESKEIQEAINSYDVIIVDDFERIFGNKNMSMKDIFKVFHGWTAKGKTVIVFDQIPKGKTSMDKHDQKFKLADELIKVNVESHTPADDEDGYPKYQFSMHSIKANQAYPAIKFHLEVYEAPIEYLPSEPSVLTVDEVLTGS